MYLRELNNNNRIAGEIARARQILHLPRLHHMKHTFLLVAMLATLSATAQLFVEPKIGMSSRLLYSVNADFGYRFYNDIHVSGTAGYEQIAGTNMGAVIGWQPRALMPFVGYGYFVASSAKMAEGSRAYPIFGLRWKDPDGKGVCDLRYMGDGIHFTMGFRLSKK